MSSNKPIVRLHDYAPTPFVVSHIDLSFDLNPRRTLVRSVLHISPRMDASSLELDGEDLTLLHIAVNGEALSSEHYTFSDGKLRIETPPQGKFTLETEVEIDPSHNTRLEGLYRSAGVWTTQCEAEGFRRITFMYDRPDCLATYSVRIEADRALAPVLLSNGNPVDAGDLPDGRHYAHWDDPHPKPTYLFALVAGDLACVRDSFTTMEGRDVALGIYCDRGKEDRCAYAMDVLKRSMVWDEEKFGRAYDLDVFNIVAVADFNAGAMENKGLNIFNDKLVFADPQTATDADFANIERVISHEYFHNWTGNRITCRDWFQLCLKEGLTVYRDQEFTADQRSRPVKRIEDVKTLWLRQFPEDSGPLAHPPRPSEYEEIDNFYTPTVYEKGAEVVRMLATLLGPEQFSAGMDLYFDRHDGDAATIEDWIKVFEDASGTDLQAFARWYTQAGRPQITVRTDWDEDAGKLVLNLEQFNPPTPDGEKKAPLPVPLQFGFVGQDGRTLNATSQSESLVRDGLMVMDQAGMRIVFSGFVERPVVSLNRNFSAPIDLVFDREDSELGVLAANDPDPVNRWMVLQDLSRRVLLTAINTKRSVTSEGAQHIVQAIGAILTDQSVDDSYRALCLDIPSQTELTEALGENVDPAKIADARLELKKTIGAALSGQLSDILKSREGYAEDDLSAQAVAARRLFAASMDMLVAIEDDRAVNLAVDRYHCATNLSTKWAALRALVMNGAAGSADLLADFDAWSRTDPLVWDKWLTLSAAQPDDGALEAIKDIYAHEDFPHTNPNRLRALIGAFMSTNPVQFSRPDGAGYEFVADVIARTDPINPKVAARLLTGFSSYRKLVAPRRDAAESVLRKLASQSTLSEDVQEILDRILNR